MRPSRRPLASCSETVLCSAQPQGDRARTGDFMDKLVVAESGVPERESVATAVRRRWRAPHVILGDAALTNGLSAGGNDHDYGSNPSIPTS